MSAQPTTWVSRALEHETEDTEILLAPDASRTLLEWALKRANAELVAGVVLVVTDDEGPDFLLLPSGQMREVSTEVVADSSVAARIVAARRTARLPLEQQPAESAAAPERVAERDHTPDLPRGTSGAPVDGPWRPYEVDGGYMARQTEHDVFDPGWTWPTFDAAWPRCWYLNAVIPDGQVFVEPPEAPAGDEEVVF